MARLVHSFWTRPSMGDRWGFRCEQLFYNLWYFALSVAYAKKIGAPIVLHTDTLGERLFGHLPYDDIRLTLDDIDPPYRFWAAGKFYAMQAESDPRAIHIDGDVFIKKPELWERMANSKADLIVRCKEDWQDTFQRDVMAEYMHPDYFDHGYMYNTGVMGFLNPELKAKIIAKYMAVLDEAKAKLPEAVLREKLESPDLVCEQQMVAYMSEGYTVDALMPWHDMRRWAVENGYQHVLSLQKFACLPRCKEVLRSINRDIYEKTKKICQNL